MSAAERNTPIITYRKAVEVANLAIRHRQAMGFVYRDGAVRAAALLAVKQLSVVAIIDSISHTLREYEIQQGAGPHTS